PGREVGAPASLPAPHPVLSEGALHSPHPSILCPDASSMVPAHTSPTLGVEPALQVGIDMATGQAGVGSADGADALPPVSVELHAVPLLPGEELPVALCTWRCFGRLQLFSESCGSC
uniref:Uncharacterized protein n=1 Tax=Aquila chrysaetos chrysaetos TaxID=223781 RepID=A0A663F7F4_AQUCH